jgi:hypothetical protein
MRQLIFKGDKNPQHAFHLEGSKAGCPLSRDFTACKRLLGKYEKNASPRPNSPFPSPVPPV